MFRRLLPLLLWCLAAFATANTITYYPDKTSAIAGCQNEGSLPGQACQPSGYAVNQWCNLVNGCTGMMTTSGTLGCAVVIQTYEAAQPGGSCGITPKTEYHYHAYPQNACPAGTVFVGPTGTDCVLPAVATTTAAAQKQIGAGIANGRPIHYSLHDPVPSRPSMRRSGIG